MPYAATNWRFVDSNGWDASILAAGVSMQSFYFREGASGQIFGQDIGCISANIGVGLEFSLNFSPRSLMLPSLSIGRIYRTSRVGTLQARHFGANWLIMGIGAGALMSGNVSMVLFGAASKAAVIGRLLEAHGHLATFGATGPLAIRDAERAFRQAVDQFNGFGFVSGTSVGINLGLGASEAICVT